MIKLLKCFALNTLLKIEMLIRNYNNKGFKVCNFFSCIKKIESEKNNLGIKM